MRGSSRRTQASLRRETQARVLGTWARRAKRRCCPTTCECEKRTHDVGESLRSVERDAKLTFPPL